ncbi:MAG: type II toxin-antitoxin system HicB family antitoxin [bacterium]
MGLKASWYFSILLFVNPCNSELGRKAKQIDLHVDYFEEEGVIVALCPQLQVSSFGNTLQEAETSIREAIELFFEGCESLGTLDEILEESGFRKSNGKWVQRKPVKTTETTFQWADSKTLFCFA